MIHNWNEFDQKLKQVAIIDANVSGHARSRDLALVDAQAAYDRATKTPLALRDSIASELERFYKSHRKEVEADGKKSIELNFGRAGCRAKAARLELMKGFKWPDVIAAIKANFAIWKAYIRTKESVDKEALKKAKLDPETLAQLHVALRSGEEFFFETFPEKATAEAA